MLRKTFDRFWKPHVAIEVVFDDKRVAKRYYVDLLDSFEDDADSPNGALELDLLTFLLFGATAMSEFIDMNGACPLVPARGMPTNLSPSVQKIFYITRGNDQKGCEYMTYLTTREVIDAQRTLRQITGGRPSRTITYVLGPMRAIQDFGEGEPRLVFWLERVEGKSRKHVVDAASQFRT